MAVIDVFTYNGETQILKLHLAVLNNYVDKFVIVEADKTFAGNNKPLHFFRTQRYFQKYHSKISYYVVNTWDDVSLWEQAISSPNTKGADHWKREFYIKESIHKALEEAGATDDDTIILGDVDEVIDPTAEIESTTPIKAKLRVYAYHLNLFSSEEFWGPVIAQYKDIKNTCLNHLRCDTAIRSKGQYLGWHFTNQGGLDEIRRKLADSYTEQSYYTLDVQNALDARFAEKQDYLGRDFTYSLNESDWPQYLKDNRDIYKRMCLNPSIDKCEA